MDPSLTAMSLMSWVRNTLSKSPRHFLSECIFALASCHFECVHHQNSPKTSYYVTSWIRVGIYKVDLDLKDNICILLTTSYSNGSA